MLSEQQSEASLLTELTEEESANIKGGASKAPVVRSAQSIHISDLSLKKLKESGQYFKCWGAWVYLPKGAIC